MSTFSVDVAKFVEKAKVSQRKAVVTICNTLLRDIIFDTPVDTGRARGNWQASIGAPAGGVLETADLDGNATIAKAQSSVIQAPGNVFWITNNLPYIGVLEFGQYGNPPGSANGPKTIGGYSKQSPAGMVRVAIANLQADLR
jgi:hypothetical protein